MSKPLEIVTEVPTENQIRNAIAEYLIYDGWLVIRINSGAAVVTENNKRRFVSFVKWMSLGQGTQTAGVSDLLCIKAGHPPIVIETKRPGNTPTEAQKRFMAQWEAHGGVALVAESVADVERILNQ